MTNARTLKTLTLTVLTGACCVALAAAAAAQDNGGGFDISNAPAQQQTATGTAPQPSLGEVTLGVTGLSGATDVFGRYNGMTKDGAGLTASFNLHDRDAWDSGGTRYFNATGNNLTFGLGNNAPEANITAKVGDQGTWSVTASYDAMTYEASDHFTSILTKSGTLTPGYQNALISANMFFSGVPANPSTLFGTFNASTGIAAANPVTVFGPANQAVLNIGTRRDKGTLEGTYQIGDWLLTSSVSHEHKEGTLEDAMTTGGNNAGMTSFPLPIDYDTDLYTASAAYNTDDLQARLAYEFSNFIDHNDGGYAFEGWNFAAYKSPAPVTYTSFQKSGNYATPPSNQAHTITGELGYNIDDTTRVYATAVLGLQMQNETFVPATNLGYFNLAAAAPLAAQLASNPASLDGYVDTFFGNVTLTSRPLTDLDLTASYKIDTRDPHTTAMSIYGDPTDTNALKFRQAVPESWTKQEVSLQAGYRLMPETRVTAGYTYRAQHRGNAITHDTSDNEFTVGVHSMLTDSFTGTLNYLHANRTASAPDWSLWLVQIPSDCGSTLAALGCQQVPFYEAARTQDTVNGTISGMLDSDTSVTLFAKYNADDYHSPAAVYKGVTTSSVGLNRDYSIDAGPDLNYRLNKDASVHFYYTFERFYRNMRALNNQSVVGGLPYYQVASTYDIHTGGLGATWQVDDQWKLVGDYTLNYGGEHFAQSGTWDAGTPGDPVLDTKSLIHQVKLHADYQYSDSTSLYLGYEFDSLDNTDWALVGASVGQVLTGDVPAKYNVSKFMAAVTLKL